MIRTLILGLAIAVSAPGGAALGQPTPDAGSAFVEEEERLTEERRRMREDFAGIGVDERLGEVVDLSIPFVDHTGRKVTFGEYVGEDLPVVLAFVYHSCPMLCSLVLDGISTVLRETRLAVGRDYRFVAVSIDPHDTPDLAAEARERYLTQLEGRGNDHSYAFLTGSQEAISQLTAMVGFRYEWIESRQEYAHAAVLTFLSPNGAITRYLYGLQFPAVDFRRAVVEAGQGTVGSTMDQLLLYCFVYDPDSGGYVVHAANAMKLGGLATLLILVLTLLTFWRREALTNVRRRTSAGRWTDYEDALRMTPGS